MTNPSRPLSPHLSIYKPQITSVLSILHRITGVALYAGLVLLIVFLCVVAYAPEYYATLHECLSSILGQVMLAGWAFAFYYHFYNGIRHLFWDMGKGFDLPSVNRTGWAVVILAFASTAMSLFVAYYNSGVM